MVSGSGPKKGVAVMFTDTEASGAQNFDARIRKDAKVLGDVLLTRVQHGGEVSDSRFARAELVENLDAHWLANRTEAARNQVDDLFGKRVG